MDYGAPVGFRLAAKHPERVQSLIIQNGNAYDEGLREFWEPFKTYWKDSSDKNAEALRKLLTLEATKWQYTHGTRQVEAISPDNWLVDQTQLDRPGNKEIQLALFVSYGQQSAALSEVAGILPQAPAAHAHRLGQERPHLPGRRRGALSPRPQESGVPPHRYRPLRARRRRREPSPLSSAASSRNRSLS